MNICLGLYMFKNYDYIINYGYYHKNFKKYIELYQEYIFTSAYLSSDEVNYFIDFIMMKVLKDQKFYEFLKTNYDFNNIDFKDQMLDIYYIYKHNYEM